MNYKKEWEKIVIARFVEIVLTAAAFGVGIWYNVKSQKLDEKLDRRAAQELKENEEEKE